MRNVASCVGYYLTCKKHSGVQMPMGNVSNQMDARVTAPMVTAKMTAAIAPELIAEKDQVSSRRAVD